MMGQAVGQQDRLFIGCSVSSISKYAFPPITCYARAHSLLAWTHFFEFLISTSVDPRASLREAMDAGQRAVQLDDTDVHAHAVLSVALCFARRFDTAMAEAERAVAFNPNLAFAVSARGSVRSFSGQPEEGADDCRRAIRLSPRDPSTFAFLNVLAICEYTSRDYASAAETAWKLTALKPDYIFGHWHVAGSCAQLGQMDRAREALGEVMRLNPNFDRSFMGTTAPFMDIADLEHMINDMRKAGWEG